MAALCFRVIPYLRHSERPAKKIGHYAVFPSRWRSLIRHLWLSKCLLQVASFKSRLANNTQHRCKIGLSLHGFSIYMLAERKLTKRMGKQWRNILELRDTQGCNIVRRTITKVDKGDMSAKVKTKSRQWSAAGLSITRA